MVYDFKLQLTRVKVVTEQLHEPGKDELRLIGFGVSRLGTLFSAGYRNLGSYAHDADVSTGIFPMTLFEGELEDDGLDVATVFWLIEEDSGALAENAEALETKFREAYGNEALELRRIGFPRRCIPLTAFYRALIPFTDKVEAAGRRWWNSDDVGDPNELYFRFEGQSIVGHTDDVLAAFTGVGVKNLYLTYSYKRKGFLDS